MTNEIKHLRKWGVADSESVTSQLHLCKIQYLAIYCGSFCASNCVSFLSGAWRLF